MAHGDVHTVHRSGRWYNDVEGGQRGNTGYPTKVDATAAGRMMARRMGVEHFIHDLNGEFGARNTYPRSRDPQSSRG